MRAAIYTRVSTDQQAEHGHSLEEQERRCRDFIDREHGWEYVATFADAGLSGTLKSRPQLDRLLASTDDIDVVVIHSLDRLGRSTKNLLELYDRFERDKVGLVFLRERLDTTTPVGRLLRTVLSAIAEFERDLIAERTSTAISARARKGDHTGGPAPYGYRWEDKRLVKVPAEAEVVERVFADYCDRGMSQRAIVRSLNEGPVPTRHGGPWQQSAITKMLSAPVYRGKLSFKGQLLDGQHDPIVSEEVWKRAQAIRSGALKQKPGRHPDGGHLLTKGVLRCVCGAAMVPRKARQGVERERYVCRGRIENPASCSQPSIRRELIDEPFLAHLLDGYIDLEATRRRIEERMLSAVSLAREALAQAEREAATAEAKLARVRGHYQEGKIEADDWAEQRPELTAGLDAAREAVLRAREHVQEVEQAGVVGDGEQVLLDYLAALKRAAGRQAGAAPDLNALRNLIGQMFESVSLVRAGTIPVGVSRDGVVEQDRDPTVLEADGENYWLLLTLRVSAVDIATLTPIGQEMPVPPSPQYPTLPANSTLCRYCWW